MFISTLILVFGLLFVLRIYYFNEQNRIFNNQLLKNSLLIIIFLTLSCSLFVVKTYFLLWLTVFFATLALAVTIFVTIHFRERKFRQDFVDFLDRVILQVRSGQSFYNALELASAKTSSSSHLKLQKIIEAVHFSQKIETSNDFIREIHVEMSSVQLIPHKILDRLCAFRRKIKIEDDFRRRSGRIVRQTRIQISFLTVLYAAVLVFVLSKFGFSENSQIILWSAGLFSAGLVGFFILGVKKQWKI